MGTEGKSRETSLEEIYAAMELLPLQLTEAVSYTHLTLPTKLEV